MININKIMSDSPRYIMFASLSNGDRYGHHGKLYIFCGSLFLKKLYHNSRWIWRSDKTKYIWVSDKNARYGNSMN